MTPLSWRCLLGLLSALILVGDAVTSPYIQFPILFVIPVGLAAWHISRGAAIGFGAGLIISRLVFVATFEREAMPLWAAGVNAGIRLSVLVGLAALVASVRQQQLLAKRVQILECLLQICMYCKSIRGPDGGWERIEKYIRRRTATEFSHGLCEACARKHYPDVFPPPDGQTSSKAQRVTPPMIDQVAGVKDSPSSEADTSGRPNRDVPPCNC